MNSIIMAVTTTRRFIKSIFLIRACFAGLIHIDRGGSAESIVFEGGYIVFGIAGGVVRNAL